MRETRSMYLANLEDTSDNNQRTFLDPTSAPELRVYHFSTRKRMYAHLSCTLTLLSS